MLNGYTVYFGIIGPDIKVVANSKREAVKKARRKAELSHINVSGMVPIALKDKEA